jgi:glyoxylase-like metal-dependent hydrolase (beta-lactamase superfamily II)
MSQQVSVDPQAIAPGLEQDDTTTAVLPDLAYKRLAIVNVAFYGLPQAGDRNWILIDAGIPGSSGAIRKAAAGRFGENARPAVIIQTHGHFDHVGALENLAAEWDAPVYAHELEIPYLNGTASYPPPDPMVGGGLMALVSPLYPRGPVKVSTRLNVLPPDGSVPFMPGWRWIHTPGHTPGQIALWRAADRALLAADAFITTAQESAYAVAVQKPELHGPPMYYTQNWQEAKTSVEILAALQPEIVVTGHGPAMQGEAMRQALSTLAQNFEAIAVPDGGKYVSQPASAVDGTAYNWA